MGYDLYQMQQKEDRRYEEERKEVKEILTAKYVGMDTDIVFRETLKRTLLAGVKIGFQSMHITERDSLITYIKAFEPREERK